MILVISAKLIGWHKYPNRLTISIKCWMYHHQLSYYFFKEKNSSIKALAYQLYENNGVLKRDNVFEYLKNLGQTEIGKQSSSQTLVL